MAKCTEDLQKNIRKAVPADVSRIAEIYVFNNRQVYYPVFHNTRFSFEELQVIPYANELESKALDKAFVYDDGIIKGFMIVDQHEIDKLHVDSYFRGNKIGGALLNYAVSSCGANYLWVLKKNEKAIGFYEKNGFVQTPEEKLLKGVGDHTEAIVKMILKDRGENE